MTKPTTKRFSYYNDLKAISFKEYGRSIQDMVQHIAAQEDKAKRTEMCYAVIEMIRKIMPSIPMESEDDKQKLWDSLHIMSGFTLDIDGPYPAPEPEVLQRKPQRLAYNKNDVRHKHYGKHLDLMVARAVAIEDPEEKRSAVISLGRLMKNFYVTWNKNNIEDQAIIKQLHDLSNGKLTIDLAEVQAERLFDTPKDQRPVGPPQPSQHERERPHGGNRFKYKNRGKRR